MDELAVRPASGATRTVGILGWPVVHSLSPAIHNAAFRALGLDWIYVPLPAEPSGLHEAVSGLRALGFAGANVTMPHKTSVARIVDSLSEDARLLDAVNTIVVEGSSLSGHNTDAPGFERFLRDDAAFDAAGSRALILGAGGAARACALALARGDAASIVIASRDPSKAEPIARSLDRYQTAISPAAMNAVVDLEVELVVNATPLGSNGETPPHPPLGPSVVLVDLVTHPAITPLQSLAREGGAAAFGGVGLLLHQAALSFELWTGQQPPLDVMSAAAIAAIAERG